MPRGRKDICKDAKPFTKESSRLANEIKRIKRNTFKSASKITDSQAPDEMVTKDIERFWKMRNVKREDITPMMAEVTAIYAKALYDKEEPMSLIERITILERIYRLFGIAYESNHEHNASEKNSEGEERSFEINYIVDGIKQEPPLRIECEQVESNGS